MIEFSECFPNMLGVELTPEERTEWRDFFLKLLMGLTQNTKILIKL